MRPFVVSALALAIAACSSPPPGGSSSTSRPGASASAAAVPPLGASALAASGQGKVTLVCKPSCDDISEDGKSLGPLPIIQQVTTAGEHHYTARLGAVTKTIDITVVAGEHHARRVDMDGEAPPELPKVNRNTTRAELEAMRAPLEPKVLAGKGTLDEARLLRVICGKLGDDKCREAATREVLKLRGDVE
jgi:hypothetical protein